ncbi:MAG: hypothetical protein N3E45_11765 [Oscillatoriaceae bacterium SKW80]|nr:hypothetical protein [Oscillatoriaceae bacterium SKYG93]MCX8121479.1 hypothetical protein [Oscillatoriaceae bacterium SKW80]MDW8452935.1 hypothetical protein [Oscillatoriaceae cyanobacterium SKYGB_i_bin93]
MTTNDNYYHNDGGLAMGDYKRAGVLELKSESVCALGGEFEEWRN